MAFKAVLHLFGRADKTRQREAGKAKANGSNSSLPAFEEDQEVERQAMLSSPPKKGKRITSEVCVLLFAASIVVLTCYKVFSES